MRTGEKPLLLKLIQHRHVAADHTPGHREHEFRTVDQCVEDILNAHPHADRIPDGQVGVHALSPHLNESIEQLMRLVHPPLALRRVVADHRQADLLQILIPFKLVDKGMADHIIGRIRQRDSLLRFNTEATVVDRQRDADERIHHPVDGKMVPLVEDAAEGLLIQPAHCVFTAQCQLVFRHLMPADLINLNHRPFYLQAVQLRPEHSFFFLNRQCRDFSDLGRQPSQDLLVVLPDHWVDLLMVRAPPRLIVAHLLPDIEDQLVALRRQAFERHIARREKVAAARFAMRQAVACAFDHLFFRSGLHQRAVDIAAEADLIANLLLDVPDINTGHRIE